MAFTSTHRGKVEQDKILYNFLKFLIQDVRNCWMENILVSSSFQAEPISTAASEYKEVGHFLESNKSATLPSSVKYGTPAANLPMKPPVKANTCGRNVKLQPSITGAKADEPIYDELFLQKKEHNCTKKPDPTIHNVEQIPAEYMYAVPLLDQYKEFSDEQIKELLSAFQNILKKRGEEPEQMERPPQFGLSASIVSGRNSPTKPDGYTIIDTGDKKDSVDIPPPVPPKKKRGPNRGKSCHKAIIPIPSTCIQFHLLNQTQMVIIFETE